MYRFYIFIAIIDLRINIPSSDSTDTANTVLAIGTTKEIPFRQPKRIR